MEIEGKRVLLTGANRDLGRALALACLGAGAREVLAGARQTESLENLRTAQTYTVVFRACPEVKSAWRRS